MSAWNIISKRRKTPNKPVSREKAFRFGGAKKAPGNEKSWVYCKNKVEGIF